MFIMIKKKKQKIRLVTVSLTAFIAVIILAGAAYLGDYYHADEKAVSEFESDSYITVSELENGDLVFMPQSAKDGLIFYPGGKVEYKAYIPLMKKCAEQGICCILLKMPFNLAVFDINGADGIINKYSQIENWYIGGHSLGGSMACAYLKKHVDEYSGLVLLGSYSTEDFSDSPLKAISIYGSEDRVLNRENYEKNRSNLPKDYEEFVIDGGCHAFFGMYGIQDKDGTATITNEEQIKITAEKIKEFVMTDKNKS